MPVLVTPLTTSFSNIELIHSYDPLLFICSVAIAAFAGYVALWLIGRVPAIEDRQPSSWWLAAASAAMGVGIWSMHFTGMLALRLPGPVGYEWDLTLLSAVIAVGVSVLALAVIRRQRVPKTDFVGASVLMGGAIAGMHYTGMAGMRTTGEIFYRPGLVVASIVVAVIASGAALGLFLRHRTGDAPVREWVKVTGGIVLGLAVSGLHYTGMAAARFRNLTPDATLSGTGLLRTEELAIWVGGGSFVVLGMGLVAAVLDRHFHARYAAELEEVTKGFQQIFRESPVGIALVSAEGRPVQANRALAEMLGYSPEELREMAFPEFTHPEDVDKETELFEKLVAGEIDDYQIEKRYITRTGEVVWGDLRIGALPSFGDPSVRAMGFVRDITAQKQLEDRLRYESFHDPLTGLANRSLLQDRLEQGLARSRRHGTPLGLLMLDIDHFKRVNDELGHTAGDQVLAELARRFEKTVREEDTVARWGGDEFVVVLPELAEPEAVTGTWERLRAAARSPIEIERDPIRVDLTAGAVVHADEDHPRTVQARDQEELTRFGSLALHWAKEDKPGGFSFYDRTRMGKEGATPIRREGELRAALDRGEIFPYYQPIVRLEDRTRMSVEALARWRHPEEGILGPAEFIPLAEKLGLIRRLQEAVVRQGCRELVAMEEASDTGAPTKIRFNISGQQFRAPALAEQLEEVVIGAGARPEQVIVEVTETSTMQVPATVNALREGGFEVSIDDFGTGYSTLTYLRDLDVDELKIDMTFVQGIVESRSDAALVDTMLTLGDRLGLRVVAEGIETEGQVRKLRSIGCSFGQGYLFARPGRLEGAGQQGEG